MASKLDLKTEERHEKWREFVHSLNPEIDPDTVRLMDRYFLVSHGLRRVGENSLTASGLSYPKYRLLLGLMYSEKMDGLSELNPSEISRRQGTSRNTISALIKDLEDEGLVERQLDQSDKRRFNIRLTRRGREVVRRHAMNHFEAVASCFRSLGVEDKEKLGQLLNKLSRQAFAGVSDSQKK